MTVLKLGEDYTRVQVHSLYGGNVPFTRGSGTWGLHGMLRTYEDRLSWVFYVKLGHKEGDHQFVENISNSGILTWQSQPSLTLDNPKIKDLVAFNSNKHDIHLFLKNENDDNFSYKYLGRLDYLSHDIKTEKPVHFKWQLLDWEDVKKYNLGKSNTHKKGLEKVDIPKTNNNEYPADNVNTASKVDTVLLKEIGNQGEKLVLEYEKNRLKSLNRSDLAEKVIHISDTRGDGEGFDILSYFPDGSEMFIEVKTTTQNRSAAFFISANELNILNKNKSKFMIYRVFSLDKENGEYGKLYTISADELLINYDLVPESFKVKIK